MQKKSRSIASGRPREFNTDLALESAIQHFSVHGYHGSSISDLNAALGLTTGSIYKAWGDKHGLLMAALERYIELRSAAVGQLLSAAPNGLAKLEALLGHYADISSGKSGEVGCLVVETAMELSASDELIAARLARQEASRRAQFTALLQEADRDGSLPAQDDIASCADLLIAMTQGMRVLGKSGSSRERMQAIVDKAITLLKR
ncbi:TetR/AcrR family transcriptional regulator [Erwinia sp. SLM-02]|uniref:TetR/AcrR family transcriptional regulator n=1 Tax=Erwinia sp. SLM-02 TaxID=3020057 RepID=UPI003080D356